MAPAVRRLIRVLKIGAAVGAVAAAARALRGRRPAPVTGEASWPPLAHTDGGDEPPTATAAPESAPTDHEPPTTQGWVEPVDGVCPASHPVKGNADSGIFHVPGGMFYDRTTPERCYATAADAEADGFRPAKR